MASRLPSSDEGGRRRLHLDRITGAIKISCHLDYRKVGYIYEGLIGDCMCYSIAN